MIGDLVGDQLATQSPVDVSQWAPVPQLVEAVQRHTPDEQVEPVEHCAEVVHDVPHAPVELLQRSGPQKPGIELHRG